MLHILSPPLSKLMADDDKKCSCLLPSQHEQCDIHLQETVKHPLFPDVFATYEQEREVLERYNLSHTGSGIDQPKKKQQSNFLAYITDLMDTKNSAYFADKWMLPYLHTCPSCEGSLEPYKYGPMSIQICENQHLSWPCSSEVFTVTEVRPPYLCRGRFFGKEQLMQQAKNRASAACHILSLTNDTAAPSVPVKRKRADSEE
jgi:hypothetical protein